MTVDAMVPPVGPVIAAAVDRILDSYAVNHPLVRQNLVAILQDVAAAVSKRTIVDLAGGFADLTNERDLAIHTRDRAQAEATAAVLARREAEARLTDFLLADSVKHFAGQPCALGRECPGYMTHLGLRFHPTAGGSRA